MRDPVTLPTGITYDRDGMERWLLAGASSCPLTKQPVAPGCEPTPNHTLRRLIQAWCALHAHVDGVDCVSTPPKHRASLAALVSRLADKRSPPPRQRELLAVLHELKGVASESERNRKLLAAVPGAVDALAAVFVASATSSTPESAATVRDEALDAISSF